MKILRLEAENIKRLKAVTIQPGEGGLVVIRGDNGQGKTSVLDSIAYALGGKSVQPPKVIRDGATEAKVVLELDDITVERRWTANDKSYLEVRSKDGAKFASPQTMLDSLVGRLSFDPLAFLRLEPKQQAEALQKVAGVDPTPFDERRAQLFTQRTGINRTLERHKAQLAPLRAIETVAPVDVAALLSQLTALSVQQVAEQTAATKRASEQAELDQLEKRLAELVARRDELRVKLSVALLSDPATAQKIEAVKAELGNAESRNAQARSCAERDRLLREEQQSLDVAEGLTEAIAEVDKEKAAALASAKFPVPGLGFGENGVELKGVPLEQASGAEQLRVSLAMGIALNPKLKVLLIRDGSLLDEKSMALVAAQAEAAGAQVWLEVVGSKGVGVVIEDGSVSEGMVSNG